MAKTKNEDIDFVSRIHWQRQSMINVICEYIASIGDPGPRWPEMEFDKVSYTRWAAEEVLNYVLDHPEYTVIRAVEEINSTFIEFSLYTLDERNFIFDIAKDASGNILEILYAMV